MKSFFLRLRQLAVRFSPHGYLAPLLVLDGVLLVWPVAERVLRHASGNWFQDSITLINVLGVSALPQAVIAVELAILALGILMRARLAWALSLVLLGAALLVSLLGNYHSHAAVLLSLALAGALIFYWRNFSHTSLASSSLFAILSVGLLVNYSVFGTLYFGDGFKPPIHDLVTALYFSIVTMTTSGFGDIVPRTATARLFTVSVTLGGITVFMTSISAVIGPVIGENLKRIIKGRISTVNRKHHYLIVGTSPVAYSVFAGLRKRGYPVTVIVSPTVQHLYPDTADVIIGDPSDTATLHEAGAEHALAVLALRPEDAENAFVILAIRELAPKVRTVAMVNDHRNLRRLHLLQPDMVFSPQMLAGELLARTLNDEDIDNDLVGQLLFGRHDIESDNGGESVTAS